MSSSLIRPIRHAVSFYSSLLLHACINDYFLPYLCGNVAFKILKIGYLKTRKKDKYSPLAQQSQAPAEG